MLAGSILLTMLPRSRASGQLTSVLTSVLLTLSLVCATRGFPLQGQNAKQAPGQAEGVEILSDTRGVDFKPYTRQILSVVFKYWLTFLPAEAAGPAGIKGVTLIRFSINPDGELAAMHLDGSTHNEALNRAAWAAITSVGRFPPLPKSFDGPNLELRVQFLVNRAETEVSERLVEPATHR